jgi:hypothetical protein
MDEYGTGGAGWNPTPDILFAGPDAGRRRKLPAALATIGVVVVVVAVGGGLFAYHKLASTGSMPDTMAPVSSIAFAELDLDPAAAEKVSAYEFAKKFPSLPKAANADALKDALLTEIFADSGSGGGAKIDYPTQIQPWLGSRVAIDEFVDSTGQPQTVGIVATTDATKATTALTAITAGGRGAFLVKGHYVLLGATTAVVTDAATQAAASTIADNATYTKDVATLHSDRILTAWLDAGAAGKAVAGRAGNLLDRLAPGGLAGELPGAASGQSTAAAEKALEGAGQIVIGLRLESGAADLEGRQLGATATTALQTGDAVKVLGQLPADTVGGFSVVGPEQALKTELTSLQTSSFGPQLQKFFDSASASSGLQIPADVENLLGGSLAAGISSAPGDGSQVPFFTVVTTPGDPAAASAAAHKLTLLAGDQGLVISSSVAGDQLTLSNQAPDTGATLGDLAGFTAMFSSMPTATEAAGYVDLTKVWAAERSVPAAATHLTGLGFVVGKDSTSPVFDLRLSVS